MSPVIKQALQQVLSQLFKKHEEGATTSRLDLDIKMTTVFSLAIALAVAILVYFWAVVVAGQPNAFVLAFLSLLLTFLIVFLFSAIVSGIAGVMLVYMVTAWWRERRFDMACLDTIGRYLFYAFVIDFSLEMLDLIHRIYEADESFHTLDFMVQTRLYFPHILVQIVMGTLVPLGLLALTQLVKLTDGARRGTYATAGLLTLVGIFAMRWNVVIGGQLFSKSFLGYTTYKMQFATREGLLPAIALMILPFVILWVLVKLLPPWLDEAAAERRAA